MKKGLVLFAVASLLIPGVSAATPQIVVGPNVLVSSDIDEPKGEVSIAAAPWDPNVLIGGSMTVPTHGTLFQHENVVYVTTDGGANWTVHRIPGTLADPQVAAGCRKGRLLATGYGVTVTSSTDTGAIWSPAVSAGTANAVLDDPGRLHDWDHPQLAMDCTVGSFGRSYVDFMAEEKGTPYWLGLLRSTDGGQKWKGPVYFSHGVKGFGQNVPSPPLVLRDGTLLLPIIRWPSVDLKNGSTGSVSSETAWLMKSTDGGLTFAPPQRVFTQTINRKLVANRILGMHAPYFAVDTSPVHPNRIYMAWLSDDVQPGRIFVEFSDDRGNTWSHPVVVDPGAPAEAGQWIPAIGINKNGIVGVRWFDSRNTAESGEAVRDEYFAASVDGGATFLPAVRVSTQSSPFFDRQLFWQASAGEVTTTKAFSGSTSGGHYEALTADARGAFHDLWADSRGKWGEVYTAVIEVQPPTEFPSPLQQTTVGKGKFEVVYGKPHYDENSALVEVPFSVINRSDVAWYGPVQLTVKSYSVPPNYVFKSGERPPYITASSAYTLSSISPDGILLPGQGTAPVTMQIDRTADSPLEYDFSYSLAARIAQ